MRMRERHLLFNADLHPVALCDCGFLLLVLPGIRSGTPLKEGREGRCRYNGIKYSIQQTAYMIGTLLAHCTLYKGKVLEHLLLAV